MMPANVVYLAIAIVAEVIATSALKASDAFTKPVPLLITAIGYAVAFYFLALTLRAIPVGIAYAIWSGLGIVLISLVGVLWFRQSLDLPALAGLGLIVAGVIVINVFSNSVVH
ncbi:MAG TPA: SMR family transporter [Pseudolabrys sp.]|nr:SMR family transporter [Pseudolabrys sp.]